MSVERRRQTPGSLMILSGAYPGAPRYTVLQRNAFAGPLEPTPERASIAEAIATFKSDLVIFDSLASLAAGKVSENANLDMDALTRELQTIAKLAAVLTIHHTSKSKADAPGDATAARGASSVIGAVRAGLTFMPVSGQTRKAMGLLPGRYVRLDGSGSNYSPRDSRAYVWRIESGSVGNSALDAPDASAFFDDERCGDEVAVLAYAGAFPVDGQEFGRALRVLNGNSGKVARRRGRNPGDNGRAATVAGTVCAVLGDAGEQPLADIRRVLGERLVKARVIRGQARRTVINALAAALLPDGVTIEHQGQAVCVYMTQCGVGKGARYVIGWRLSDTTDTKQEGAPAEKPLHEEVSR